MFQNVVECGFKRVVALGAEPAIAPSLNSSLVRAVSRADEAVPVVVVGTFALLVFADLSLLPTAQGNYPARDTRSDGSRRRRSSSSLLVDS